MINEVNFEKDNIYLIVTLIFLFILIVLSTILLITRLYGGHNEKFVDSSL